MRKLRMRLAYSAVFSLYATCSDTMVTVEMLLIRSGRRRTLVVFKVLCNIFSRWSTSYLAILEL